MHRYGEKQQIFGAIRLGSLVQMPVPKKTDRGFRACDVSNLHVVPC